jgi:hypothetical protein
VIGHSLGSILSTSISSKYTKKAKALIGLDTPREYPCITYASGLSITEIVTAPWNVGDKSILGKNYRYSINPEGKKRLDFNDSAQLVRTFVGVHSFAGSRDLARTGNTSTQIDFDTHINNMDLGNEHVWVVQTFKQIIDQDFFESDLLGIKDLSQHNDWQRKSGGVPNFGGDEKNWSEYGWDDFHSVMQLNRQIRGSGNEKVSQGDVRRVWNKIRNVEDYKSAKFSKDKKQ